MPEVFDLDKVEVPDNLVTLYLQGRLNEARADMEAEEKFQQALATLKDVVEIHTPAPLRQYLDWREKEFRTRPASEPWHHVDLVIPGFARIRTLWNLEAADDARFIWVQGTFGRLDEAFAVVWERQAPQYVSNFASAVYLASIAGAMERRQAKRQEFIRQTTREAMDTYPLTAAAPESAPQSVEQYFVSRKLHRIEVALGRIERMLQSIMPSATTPANDQHEAA